MRTEARFPELDHRAGHYESFYLKAASPGGGRGVWIRHTVHKPPGSDPTASVWFTLFDAEAAGPRAAKATFAATELGSGDGAYIRVGGATLAPGRASGSVAAAGLEARWELAFEDRHEALRHLPFPWLYRARLPRTKLLSPHPGAVFSGSLEVDGERVEVDGWPGMIGHNWGSEHAERWIWIHAAGFEGREGDEYVDIAAGRVKVGPFTTPWVANGRLVLEGSEHRLGGPRGIYGTEIAEGPTGCELTIPGPNVNLRGRVEAPAKDFVAWVYADPDGPDHHALNCSIADLELRVERPGERHTHLRAPRSAVYEIGMRETDHGIPIQPFPDGEPAG